MDVVTDMDTAAAMVMDTACMGGAMAMVMHIVAVTTGVNIVAAMLATGGADTVAASIVVIEVADGSSTIFPEERPPLMRWAFSL